MRGRFAELDGMILKTQLFIVLIVAPSKKLWPWQNSEEGFGLDLVWLSAENNVVWKICSRIDVVPFLPIDPLLKVSDIWRWCVMEADLYEVKLWRFLWPLSCITKFSGTPASSRREIDVLRTEWLDIFLFWAAKPAFFCRRGHKFPDFVLAEWWALVPNLALAPGLVIGD